MTRRSEALGVALTLLVVLAPACATGRRTGPGLDPADAGAAGLDASVIASDASARAPDTSTIASDASTIASDASNIASDASTTAPDAQSTPLDAGALDARASSADAGTRDAAARDAASPLPDAGPPCPVPSLATCSGTTYRHVGTCAPRELHVFSVYEPMPRGTPIRVTLTRRSASLVIALSSYESAVWSLDVAAGVTVERVIVNGFDPASVTGLPAGAVLEDLSGPGRYIEACGYEWPRGSGGCETETLVAGFESRAGLPVASFHGCYAGSAFTLGDGP